MNSTIRILTILVCLSFLAPVVVAQKPQLASPSQDAASREGAVIIIHQQRLHIAAPASTQEIRLEIFGKSGESVYDSGPLAGPELSWNLLNASGEAIPSGLYAYTLTIKEADSEAPATRRGHLILESARDRLWVTSQGAIGAEAAISGAELTVASGPETSVAGSPIGKDEGTGAKTGNHGQNLEPLLGTPGRIPKFGGLLVVNSVISEDAQGRIGIGTTTPGSKLTVAGTIETTSGGIKFPNGSAQTSAGLSQVSHNMTLTGDGTDSSPLGVNIPALNLLSDVSRDATLQGNGTTASPLGIANGGVTEAKIAPGQVVKSLNGLFDKVSLTAGSNIMITPSGNSLSIAAPNVLGSVSHDATLAGDGTTASPLAIANGGVAGAKIAAGQVVKSLNGLFDNVNLTAGTNITITPSGNGLSVAAPNLLGSVATNGALTGNGTGASPLGVAVPLSLNGSNSNAILEINNIVGIGLRAVGGIEGVSVGSDGLWAIGGGEALDRGGDGVRATGGNSRDTGGKGVVARGGDSSDRGGAGGAGVIAVGGESPDGIGGIGISASGGFGVDRRNLAGEFFGNVSVHGLLSKSVGSFKIDHPLDPANKYLSHSFVESPDMMNVYNGNITTDANGEATVTLPDYFEALNRDFRYQLTVIGQFAQAIVASEISGNSFTIRTDRPGVKVSWQVTGVRQDAYANKHRIQVEEEKPERERGFYLHPEVFSQPEEKSLQWARNPELMREIKSRRENARSPKSNNDR
jgi:hypothetical protein